MSAESLHILVCPLDWGLGHASRCIPVIRDLSAAGHKVTIAGYGRSFILLQKEFPDLERVEIRGFSPSYPRSGNMVMHLFLLLPQFIYSIFSEHHHLKKLQKERNFDIIISDNRYGLCLKNIKSILITHQVMIKTPAWLRFAEYPLYRLSRKLILRFDECWVPDSSIAPGLSGDLSHRFSLPSNSRFIGPLSRFQPEKFSDNTRPDSGITAIISGPEPQRSIFEDLLVKQLTEMKIPATIIGGKTENEQITETKGLLKMISHTTTDETSAILATSALVICRSGYSSAMDMAVTGSTALFVPTPGQTEQKHLAQLYYSTGKAYFKNQENLNLKKDIYKAMVYPGFRNMHVDSDLQAVIARLKKK